MYLWLDAFGHEVICKKIKTFYKTLPGLFFRDENYCIANLL